MLDKVIILELKEDYAIAMKEGGEVIRIKRKPGMAVGDQVYVLPEDLYTEKSKVIPFQAATRSPAALRRIARMATAAAMVVLMIVALLPNLATKAYAVVSIDGQQRVQMEVDKDQSVLEVSSVDGSLPDAQLQQLKGRNLFELGPELTELLGNGPLLVAYAPYDGASDPETEQALRQMFGQTELVYLAGNAQDISSAAENSQSLGLYMLSLLMNEEHSDFLEDFYEDYFGLDDLDDEDDDLMEDDSDKQEDAFEDLTLNELMDLAKAHPEYMKNSDFREVLSDKIEERDEQMHMETGPDEADDIDYDDEVESDDDESSDDAFEEDSDEDQSDINDDSDDEDDSEDEDDS